MAEIHLTPERVKVSGSGEDLATLFTMMLIQDKSLALVMLQALDFYAHKGEELGKEYRQIQGEEILNQIK